MNKLIELLNEREVGEEWWELYYLSNGIIRDDWWNILYSYRIISKEYWFIQRLVENDKIDRNKFYDKNILKWFMTLTKEEKADSIIMNLSISDTPIDDLVSYLKNV